MNAQLLAMAEILRGSQQQCDEDGCMIAVSRQALEETLAMIAALAAPKEAGDALAYAQQLARFMWRENYALESPGWKEAADLMGVLSQIDNMLPGVMRKPDRIAAPSKEAGVDVISPLPALWDAFAATCAEPAAAHAIQCCASELRLRLAMCPRNPPGDQRQEGAQTFWERHHADMARDAGLSMTRTAPGQYSFARTAQAASPPPEAAAAVEKLQAFKDYVHQRLDAMGVPVDPESPHKAEGCRIGGRLDYIEAALVSPTGVDAWTDAQCAEAAEDLRADAMRLNWLALKGLGVRTISGGDQHLLVWGALFPEAAIDRKRHLRDLIDAALSTVAPVREG